MKMKKRYISVTLILLFSILLSSCSFVNYVKYTETSASEVGFEDALSAYLSRLDLLSSANIYHPDIRAEYRTALLDARNELNECTTLSQLEAVFNKHVSQIVLLALGSHLRMEDYQEKSQQELYSMINSYAAQIAASQSIEEILDLFSRFQSESDEVITLAEYMADRLAKLKEAFSDEIPQLPEYTEYGDDELEEINGLIKHFSEALSTAQDEETARAVYEDTKEKLLSIPTIKELAEKNKNLAIEEWKNRLEQFQKAHSISIDEKIQDLLTEMDFLSSAQEVHLKGAKFLMNEASDIGNSALADLQNGARLYLQNLTLEVDYREAQITSLRSLLSHTFDALNSCSGNFAVLDILQTAKAQILDIPTKDALWEQENTAFFEKYNNDHNGNGLEIPLQTDEASDYEELAAIIDFYAFHQTGYDSFLRDTFRVKLLYPHRNAQWEVNEVFWYSELIRGAVGITASLERISSGDYLIITLIPYAISTESNANPSPVEVERFESLVEYKPQSNYTPRGDDFEDFAYLTKFTKTVGGIWNTHQLWYALEHGYIPEVVSGSVAEATLERAKQLLRQIVQDGMSDEEKIYAIYTWFGENVIFDDDYASYLFPEDREHFPDELTATLRAFHAEGALFENLAVCEGFAKAMLIMLCLEGIECYRVFLHDYKDNAIDNLGRWGYGSHALISIKMADGLFYLSDPYDSYQHNTPYPKLHQFLIPWDFHITYLGAWTCVFADLVYAETISKTVMDNLVYNGVSIFTYTEQELEAMLESFKSNENTSICVSIFDYDILEKSFNVAEIMKASELNYYKVSYNGLDEYILYK